MQIRGFIRKSPSLVETLKNGEDCPVCLLCEKDLRHFYRWYFIEYYHDPTWIVNTLNSGGFCKKHSCDLIHMGKGHEMSLVYDYLVNVTLTRLERVLREIGKYEHENLFSKIIKEIIDVEYPKEAKKRLQPTEICPICKSISDSADKWIQDLLMDLEGEETKELYHSSRGLCMNHFRQALETASPEAELLLIQKQAEVLKKLKKDLEEYRRQSDYHCSLEPKGEEQTAWIRAIRFFTGKEL